MKYLFNLILVFFALFAEIYGEDVRVHVYVNQTKDFICPGSLINKAGVAWIRSTDKLIGELLFVKGIRKAMKRGRITLANQTTLRIKNVQLEDSGNYSCLFSTRVRRYEFFFTLKVEYPPRVLVDIEELTLKTGESAHVNCRGRNVSNLIWEKLNGPPVNNLEQTGTALFLHNITPANAGYYQCRGTDIWRGNRVELFHLHVKYKPRIIMTLLLSENQKNVVISCISFAYPNVMKSRILKDGNLIAAKEYKVQILQPQASRVTLMLAELNVTDLGLYSCYSNNTMGEEVQQLELLSLQINETVNQNVGNDCERPFSLFWNVISNSDVLTEKLYYRRLGKEVWTQVQNPTDMNEGDQSSVGQFWYPIWGLIDQQKYEAKFDMEDAYGKFSVVVPFIGENKNCKKMEIPPSEEPVHESPIPTWIVVTIIMGLIIIFVFMFMVYLFFKCKPPIENLSAQGSDV